MTTKLPETITHEVMEPHISGEFISYDEKQVTSNSTKMIIEPAAHYASPTDIAHIGFADLGGVRTLCGKTLTVREGYRVVEAQDRECPTCRASWNKMTSHGEHIIAHGSVTLPRSKRWMGRIEYTVKRD